MGNLKKFIYNKRRFLFFLFSDIFLIILSVWLSFLLRFDGEIPVKYLEEGGLGYIIILALIFTLPIFYFFHLYSFSWAYVSTDELISLFKATFLSFLSLTVVFLVFKDQEFFYGFPRSTIFISYFLIFIFTGGLRFSKRIYFKIFKKKSKNAKERILIVGAGDAGEQILRSIQSSSDSPYLPVGFVDDAFARQKVIIHGLKVLGKIDDISRLIKENNIEGLIIALSSFSSDVIKKAVEAGRKSGLKRIKVVPSFDEIINGEVSIRTLRDIQIEDLLGRKPVELDSSLIEKFIRQKKVLITGAAGSIGSELCRQVVKFKPEAVFLLDQDETGIFNISEELKNKIAGLKIIPLIADITNKQRISQIFEDNGPNIIFHAAAYKHVPLMEFNYYEAIRNNIFGTKIIAETSLKNQAEKFIFISSDKAVNPSSIMGATKRIGEMICQKLNKAGETKFISVRFGNVLDSRGSVMPIFKEQIKKGGPVEVTHSEMKRYFMLVSEACLLVVQAASKGEGGEVFVLDMGKPIKIIDLAKEMIRLSGFEPDKDIPIVFTKPRPGEKLFEEILSAEEGVMATEDKRIFKAKLSEINEEELEEYISRLENSIEKISREEAINYFRRLIPFHPVKNFNN